MFSKAVSNKLPPYCLYNHQIELEPNKIVDLGFSLLCQQTIEELLATKKYIVENLGKGFIDGGQAPFVALILFARKGDGLL